MKNMQKSQKKDLVIKLTALFKGLTVEEINTIVMEAKKKAIFKTPQKKQVKKWNLDESLFLFTVGMKAIDQMLENKAFAKRWNKEIERHTTYVEIIGKKGEKYIIKIKEECKTLLKAKNMAAAFFNKKKGYKPTHRVRFGLIQWRGNLLKKKQNRKGDNNDNKKKMLFLWKNNKSVQTPCHIL